MKQRSEQSRLTQLEREVAQLRAQLAARPQQPAPKEVSKREWLLAEAERIAHLGSWIWDVRNDEVSWSDELYRVLGLDPRSVTATTEGFFAAIHPDDRARLRAASVRQVEGAAAVPVKCRIVRPSGEVRELHMEGDFVGGPSGPRSHIVGIVVDETDRNLAAALLAQTVWELSEAQQVASLGSWRISLASGRIEWSDGMYRLLGVDPGETPSEALFYRHVHPDDHAVVRAMEGRAVATGLSGEVELRMLHDDGAIRSAIMRSRGIFDEAGALVGFQGIVQDISERKALEEAARHAQKMEAVGTLAGGVAHDFNNYLMVLSGHLDLFSIGLPQQDKAQRSLEAMRYACDRCVSLTEQLLTLSRKRPPRPTCFDLTRRIEGLSEMLRSALGATIALRIEGEPNTPPIHADPLQVEHALMNLALNARDGMTEGGILSLRVEGVCVEQSASAGLDAGYYVRLSVSDTGCGIPAELHSRIFEPFFTTKAVGKGTGLGLAMVYGVVRDAGGGIELESQPGQGTTFHLYFRPGEVRSVPLAGEESRVGRGADDGRGQRILLVEDVQLVRELLRDQLVQAGYQVDTAADGVAALNVLASHPVDALIADVIMPNMGGPELIRLARERYPQLPCLLMSGYAPSALGATGAAQQEVLLRKPFSGTTLCNALAALLGEESRLHASASP